MFQPNLKNKLLQTFSVATLLLKHVSFLQPGFFFPQPRLPTHHHNNVIYQVVCHCDSRYIGRTSKRLQERTNPLVPVALNLIQ